MVITFKKAGLSVHYSVGKLFKTGHCKSATRFGIIGGKSKIIWLELIWLNRFLTVMFYVTLVT